MERWIIRAVALFCAAGGAGLLWVFGVFVVVPWRAGRLLALSSSEMQVLGASLVVGLGVGLASLHLVALAERERNPGRYAVIRLLLIALMIGAAVQGALWTPQRG